MWNWPLVGEPLQGQQTSHRVGVEPVLPKEDPSTELKSFLDPEESDK